MFGMLTRAGLILLAAMPLVGADWNPRLAAHYLDARQKSWMEWPVAIGSGAPCISCHTQLTYLLARPALRAALAESGRTPYETTLLESVRARAGKNSPLDLFPNRKASVVSDQLYGANTVLAALLLVTEDAAAGKKMPDSTETALRRMWSAQDTNGGWQWPALDLDPWETTDSVFYGAALAAVATGSAPGGYQARPEIRDNVARMKKQLASSPGSQPLHNRLALLWASEKMPGLLATEGRKAILEETRGKQSADGGWSLAALGAFQTHDAAPPAAAGSNAYATAWTAFAMERAGVKRTDKSLGRALDWLKGHQDAQTGYWDASSMNKRYDAGSMQIEFMRDAATGFAAAALAEIAK
jgi:squalene-hopene/tetraprenyl-beta-curcumene cyclase